MTRELPDLQNQQDLRDISIFRVGITNVYFPIKVKVKGDANSFIYKTVSARTKLFVGLPKEYKGINMSRFMECLVEFNDQTISSRSMPELLELLRKKLKSSDAYARFEFDYYLERKAPVTKKAAPQRYRCAFTGVKRNGNYDFILEANVIAASLCPCSRGMSLLRELNLKVPDVQTDPTIENSYVIKDLIGDKVGMGAHNQRSHIRVAVIAKEGETIWLEDLIDLMEKEASAPVYPILKRPDEKFVTEQAYNNAKFSEDITRDVQLALEALPSVHSWSLRVFNEESIHPYDVCCYQHSYNWRH